MSDYENFEFEYDAIKYTFYAKLIASNRDANGNIFYLFEKRPDTIKVVVDSEEHYDPTLWRKYIVVCWSKVAHEIKKPDGPLNEDDLRKSYPSLAKVAGLVKTVVL